MTGLERARGQSRTTTFRASGTFIASCMLIALLAPVRTHAQGAGSDSLSLSWTAPGDDGTIGIVTSYEVRLSASPITNENFDSATLVADSPAPLPASSRQRMIVRGLTRAASYYFAVRATDDAGNVSGISNLLLWEWPLDASPPMPPSGAIGAIQAEGKAVAIRWQPNAEPDLAGYHVYRALSASGPWTRITEQPQLPTEYTDQAFPGEAKELLYQISAVDRIGNESARSANVRVTFRHPLVAAPLAWKMLPAYPNPSRLAEQARLPIEVPASAKDAHLDILDGGNQLVRRFDVAGAAFGVTELMWDGRNGAGRLCAPGVYRGWLIAGDVRQMVRIARIP
ncbi:MAG: FlgD immunoglobulin-like domain containing protein [Candidatus Eisenbacteria bacterium]